MKKNFNDEQRKEIIELGEAGFSYHEISLYVHEQYNIVVTDDCIRKIIQRSKPKKSKKNKSQERCLVLSDLHIPYHRDDILEVVKSHAKEIDTLVIAGDCVDCESISKFKELGKIPLIDEMVIAHSVLKAVEDLTPGVKRYVIYGNHEERFVKYLATYDNSLNPLHSSNILQEIIGGFQKHDHRLGQTTVYSGLDYEVIDQWHMQLNDLIIAHPSGFSKIPGRTVSNACEYFTRNGFDFNAVMIGHTHKIIEKLPNLNKWCYEIGCLCKEMPYAAGGKLGYTPQNPGYAVAVFENKQFDVNTSKIYCLN